MLPKTLPEIVQLDLTEAKLQLDAFKPRRAPSIRLDRAGISLGADKLYAV